MNWQIFGTIGYLGVLLGVGTVVLWVIHWLAPRRILARLAMGCAVASFVCASLNSSGHVDRIQIDPAEQLAAAAALKKKNRQAMLDLRGDEVAQVRFAEDSGDEFLDKAGMDEEDLKYFEKNTGGDPAWMKEKKQRGSGAGGGDELEDLIDDTEQEGGANVASLEEAAGPEPILTDEATMLLANKMDRWNLTGSRILILLALVVLVLDYLRRANLYRQATLPLPLPSAWLNLQTPMPSVVERPDKARRSVVGELKWLARRGDAFVYLAGDADKIEEVWSQMPQKLRGMDLLRPGIDGCEVDDDFVFEALWYGRSSFVIDSQPRAEGLISHLTSQWKERRSSRARTSQQVHVVWDLDHPVPEGFRQACLNFGGPSGFSLFVLNPSSLQS